MEYQAILEHFIESLSDPNRIAAEAFGLVGLIGSLIWPMFKIRQTMLMVQAFYSIAFIGHFLLLDAMTAASMMAVIAVQSLVTAYQRTNIWDVLLKYVFFATIPGILILTWFTWQGWWSAFAAIGTLTSTFARYQTNIEQFRKWFIYRSLFWIVHNLTVLSISGLATHVINTVMNLVYLRRMKRQRKTETEAVPMGAASASAT